MSILLCAVLLHELVAVFWYAKNIVPMRENKYVD